MKNDQFKMTILQDPSIELCQKLSQMQKKVWGLGDHDVLPPWKLYITPRIGGIIIAAFQNNEPIAQAVFTHAQDPNRTQPYLYLDLIGVLQEYQSQGLGEKILWHAMEITKQRNYSSIQWTYDPLEGANANLYIRKLGAKAAKYYPDYYGELTGEKHRGTATDRFFAVLNVEAKPVQQTDADVTIALDHYDAFESMLAQNPIIISIEIPTDFQQIVKSDPEKAQQ